jgi:N-formylglutamate amidohydrolase
MSQHVPASALVALRISINAFLHERRRWPAEQRGAACRDIRDLQTLLKQAAARMDIILRTSEVPHPWE